MGSQYGNFHNEEKKEFRHAKELKYFDDISCRELFGRIFSLTQLQIYHALHNHANHY